MSPVEWSDGAAQQPAPVPPPSNWPATLAGYAKVLMVALGTIPPAVALTWLQSAGVTHLPTWATPVVTVVLGIVAVLFGPQNKQ